MIEFQTPGFANYGGGYQRGSSTGRGTSEDEDEDGGDDMFAFDGGEFDFGDWDELLDEVGDEDSDNYDDAT